jgi:hypothetical protein
MKEIPRRRITVMSSLKEISTDQLGNRAVVVVGGGAFCTDILRRRERFFLHL